TITLDTGGNPTYSCNNVTFNLIVFNHNDTKVVGSNCNMPLGNNPTAAGTGDITLNGTLSGTGTFTKTGGKITFNSTAALSGFNGFVTSAVTEAGATLNLSSYSPVT